MLLRALTAREKANGPNHILALDIVHNLGKVYDDQNEPEEAEQMYLRALTGSEEVLPLGNSEVLKTARALTGLYLRHGRRSESEQLQKRFEDKEISM